MYAGMTRVVFELNAVLEGQGGTCFVSGSHKAELPFPSAQDLAESGAKAWPAAADEPDSGVWETYGCTAGSMVSLPLACARALSLSLSLSLSLRARVRLPLESLLLHLSKYK